MIRFVGLAVPAVLWTFGNADAGTVSGRVNFQGKPAAQKTINMASDPNCVQANALPVYAEQEVVNPNGTLKNVFVYVKNGLEGRTFPAPSQPVTIDQVGCRYIPHVLGVMVNQPFRMRDGDPTVHNVHAMAENNPPFNIAMTGKGRTETRKFEKPEIMVKLKCDVHPWMTAWVGVVTSPFYGVTDDQGVFSFKNLPAGNYTIEAWHEQFGTQEREITVSGETPVNVEFTFKSAGETPQGR